MKLFAKVFGQIFDSSISSDYVVRHIFMDLLVLADRDGVVDMTVDAIARRTNVPEAIVASAIEKLLEPDSQSRSGHEDGRRLVPLDSHRNWGWQIVNYEHYRTLHDEEARRTYFRDKKREYRAVQHKGATSTPSPAMSNMSTLVQDSPKMSTHIDRDRDRDRELEREPFPLAVAEGKKPRAATGGNGSRATTPAAGFETGEVNLSVHDQAQMIATEVLKGIGMTSQWVRVELVGQAELVLTENSPPTMDELRDGLVSQWRKYCECKRLHKVERPYFGAQRFFGEGLWRNSTEWKLKKGVSADGIVV